MLLEIAGDSANLFWPAGSVVFERGSRTEGLFVIISGAVRVIGDGDEEPTLLGPGEFFGELSMLLGTDHQHEVRAAEDAELLVVPRELDEELLAAQPELAEGIRRRAEERQAAKPPSADESRRPSDECAAGLSAASRELPPVIGSATPSKIARSRSPSGRS